MTLQRRLTLVAGAAVGVAVALACVVAYVATRAELRGQVDDQLRGQASLIQRVEVSLPFGGAAVLGDRVRTLPAPPPGEGGGAAYVQILGPSGERVARFDGDRNLPVSLRELAAARGEGGEHLRDVEVGGNHLRVLTTPLAEGGAVMLGRSLESSDSVLARLRWILLAVALGGIGAAAALGRAAARRVIAPIAGLTDAAEHVARTDDLSRRIEVGSEDEVGRLATRFNEMLDRLQASRAELDRSVHAQRQLVADASHELRTPITSLRTNIEVLVDSARLGKQDRRALLQDLDEQVEELGSLVADVIELARGEEPPALAEDVRVDHLAAEAVGRARRHAPNHFFTLETEAVIVRGTPDRLGRALNNLLDNAAKHSPPGTIVEVAVDAGGVTVRDYGPGVDPAEAEHLFDRFYRGAEARSRQGSGLGLAIVRQVAESHGGEVSVANAPGGGALFRLSLPVSSVAAAPLRAQS